MYFKVKNAVGESIPVSDTIPLIENTVPTETVILPGAMLLDMVWIPGGTFMMGSPNTEHDRDSNEEPQHSVKLSGFWMGKFEVTKSQWQALMGTTPWSGHSNVLTDPDSPAEYVSWNDAQSFLTEVNNRTGKTFRLPSAAEWEYACRAGTTTRFYWDDDPSHVSINYYAYWYGNAWTTGELYAHVVGRKAANTFGLFDMSGNVEEWCEDDWHESYWGAPADGQTWMDSPRGSDRIVRGGSWAANADYCRSAYRCYSNPTCTDCAYGFRVVRTP